VVSFSSSDTVSTVTGELSVMGRGKRKPISVSYIQAHAHAGYILYVDSVRGFFFRIVNIFRDSVFSPFFFYFFAIGE